MGTRGQEKKRMAEGDLEENSRDGKTDNGVYHMDRSEAARDRVRWRRQVDSPILPEERRN
jgi:hypothetical protein